ncbi:glycosyltransferase family 4 protein [Tilletiaria anomala UBC 951]|uniref:phosphatidylinositol N-acetylglucosaminyltransferase n=1 Tax=Tilletiaria anomala (strain ATCC 24038 / CBS 436.72 / UBC 951) TaxID=1037660 RepID=A0A066WDK4_TILAU|nr:glycosyltransferase family 4 protein [Tilletiaria anomala UBC 951]KDN49184.1 glycosyltransferase family 4 protein [Tilletiaria anomala UBC 951]
MKTYAVEGLLTDDEQERLCDVIWEAFDAPQPYIAPLAKSLLVGLLDSILSSPDAEPPRCRLLDLIISRSLTNIWRKKAIFAFETLHERYGTGFFFNKELMGLDSIGNIYSGLMQAPKGLESSSRRRANIAIAILQEDAKRLGLIHCKGNLVCEGTERSVLQRKWDIWCSHWVEPLSFVLRSSTTRQRATMGAHHLVDLFNFSHSALQALLHHLCRGETMPPSDSSSYGNEERFITTRAPAILSVLKFGKDLGLITTVEGGHHRRVVPLGEPVDLTIGADSGALVSVPALIMSMWLNTANQEVQLGTLGLIISSKQPTLPLSKAELDIIATYLGSTFEGLSPESRTAARGCVCHLLTRLQASTYAANRTLEGRSGKKDAQALSTQQRIIADAHTFLREVETMIRQHLRLGSSFPAASQALTYLEIFFDAKVDARLRSAANHPEGKKDAFPFTVVLTDCDMVDRLLQMAHSTYDALSERAIKVLKRFPGPLPGMENKDDVEQRILFPAKRLLLSTKEFEGINGAALLDLYQYMYVKGLGWPALSFTPNVAVDTAIAQPMGRCIAALLGSLEEGIHVAEIGMLKDVAITHPLHGTLTALQHMFSKFKLDEDTGHHDEMRALSERAFQAIDRIWVIVSPVLCSAAPEGNLGEVDERTTAMAQMTIEDGDRMASTDVSPEADGEAEPKTNGTGYQTVLSYAWRAIKESSALVSSISAATYTPSPRPLWNLAETDALGQRFITWLMHVRHRGAFSTIYPAFATTSGAIIRFGDAEQSLLPQKWLQYFIGAIAGPSGALTITRRSAGLAYSVVALLTAHVHEHAIIERTIVRLIEVCEEDQKDKSSMQNTPQIHAFNTLRYIVADGMLAPACKPFLSTLISLAISRFSSSLWTLRNAALMLFSAACIRIFSLQMVNKRDARLMLTFREFLTRFPGLDDFFAKELRQCNAALQGISGEAGADTRAFAILIFISNVRSAEMQDLPETVALVKAVKMCLESSIWKIREMAAYALVALTPESKRMEAAHCLCAAPVHGTNWLHGTWLAIWHLLRSTVNSDSLGTTGDAESVLEACKGQAQASSTVPASILTLVNLSLSKLSQSVDRPGNAESHYQLAGSLRELIAILDITQCVPQKENLLLSLGSTLNAGAGNDIQAITAAMQRIAAASDEHEAETTRAAALRALRRVPFENFATSTHVLGFVALLNFLQDDDETLRDEAAGLTAEYLASQTQAAQTYHGPYDLLFEESPRLGSSPSRCIILLHARLNLLLKFRIPWSRYLLEQLLPDDEEFEHQFLRAFPAQTRLFSEERPNLHKDRVADVKRLLQSASKMHLLSLPEAREQAGRIQKHLGRAFSLVKSTQVRSLSGEAELLVTQLLAAAMLSCTSDSASDATELTGLRQAIEWAKMDLGVHIDTPSHPFSRQAATRDDKALLRPHRIAMISDFFFPNVGGVEGHIYMISQRLLARGHKVIVITHAYDPDRVGVRFLAGGLKVYYVPYGVIAQQDALPNFLALLAPLRTILIREQIQIVHSHQALSSMGHEGITHAKTMGIKAVFTDHSLFGFADAAAIMTNKLLRFALSDIDHVVCVSNVGKENTVLRAHVDPSIVSTIPNAAVTSQFLPRPDAAGLGLLTIVVLSRLMYRKGIDLLIAAIPRICSLHPDVHFVVGGDGPKRVELEQMRERFFLQDRVELVGAVPRSKVKEHLTRGQIFLNTSLTEAFGTGIVEAASCGLFIVSTRVGGVPEVLPAAMMQLAEPHEEDIVSATSAAITYVRSGQHDPNQYHEAVKEMYSWSDAAERLEKVYDHVIVKETVDPVTRLRNYYSCGPIAGFVFCIIVVVDMLHLKLLEWLLPAEEVDRAINV